MWSVIILGIIVLIVVVSNNSRSSRSSKTVYNKPSRNPLYNHTPPYDSSVKANFVSSKYTSISDSKNKLSDSSSFIPETSVQFKSVVKGGVTCYYLYDYYPKNRFPDIDGEHQINRITVWNFKDGKNSLLVASKVSSGLINKFGRAGLSTKTLCIIPSSTDTKTSIRYNTFCSRVASNVGICNGYDLISNSTDRETTHHNNLRDINHSSYLHFGNVNEKDILLFDDVITSGKSFRNLRASLLSNGANSVTGIFLAQTVSSIGYYE